MNHSDLKKFAQGTRRKLKTQLESRLEYVLTHDDPYLRSHSKEKRIIEDLLEKKGKEQLLEETAYIWFNRLTALRFMDNRGYSRVKIVSPVEGESQPQILAEIKQGRFPKEIAAVSNEVGDLINGRVETHDPDREAYKTVLLAWCNYLGKSMPYLFKRIDDWAALLLPLDLLSGESIVADIQKGIPKEDCGDVEIIGWLYQYYISEKKDEVFAGLKKNKKITKENIPAATQLFTPDWIVRYMVENSLGRLWLGNNPESSLLGLMEYFVASEGGEKTLKISDPDEIRIMDPACGSGHILVYAFDLLFKMYEEAGYSLTEIPSLIIKNNLYGMDIDDRAASLASFALAMKARERDQFFFEKDVIPKVTASKEIDLDLDSVKAVSFSPALRRSFEYLKEAKNLGSLIPVPGEVTEEIEELRKMLKGKGPGDMYEEDEAEQLKAGLEQLEYLSPRYHCVITNPPYMGGKGMNQKLKDFVKKHYPDSKSDLFAVFMERGLELCVKNGYMGMINQQSWMFLSSYEKLREKIIDTTTIITMAHLGARAFDSIGGEVVQTTSFVIEKEHIPGYKGAYIRLVDGRSEAEKQRMFKEAVNNK